MEPRAFGTTGLSVPALGFGAMHLGSPAVEEREAARVLNEALDLGLTVIDTARGYGLSEERIGRHLAHRRSEFLLSTKVGYGIQGIQDWTPPCIFAGVDAALVRLRTDWIDIVHLHSCPRPVLERGEVTEALEACRKAGKVRVVAYSGDNEALESALVDARFTAVQLSLNVCDQAVLDGTLSQAGATGRGVIVKRPLGGAVGGMGSRPLAEVEGAYWERWQRMNLPDPGIPFPELALRFAAFQPGVHTCIVGTARVENLRRNQAAVGRGPLPGSLEAALRSAFRREGRDWSSFI
jgi:aryl-alcohol dehydrogenase-like predicted oxidoreductase